MSSACCVRRCFVWQWMNRTALINHSDIYREWCPGSSSVCSRWTVSRDVAGPQWCRHRVIISSQHLRRFRLLRHSVIATWESISKLHEKSDPVEWQNIVNKCIGPIGRDDKPLRPLAIDTLRLQRRFLPKTSEAWCWRRTDRDGRHRLKLSSHVWGRA